MCTCLHYSLDRLFRQCPLTSPAGAPNSHPGSGPQCGSCLLPGFTIQQLITHKQTGLWNVFTTDESLPQDKAHWPTLDGRFAMGHVRHTHCTEGRPRNFFHGNQELPTPLLRCLLGKVGRLFPVPTSRHGLKSTYVPLTLQNCQFTFLRRSSVRTSLQKPYEDHFRVLQNDSMAFIIDIDRRS